MTIYYEQWDEENDDVIPIPNRACLKAELGLLDYETD